MSETFSVLPPEAVPEGWPVDPAEWTEEQQQQWFTFGDSQEWATHQEGEVLDPSEFALAETADHAEAPEATEASA